MLNVFLSILPIFLLIFLGFLSKFYIKDVAVFWSFSEKFVYYLFFPALLILDVSEADFSGAESFYPVMATIIATLTVALIIFAGKLLFDTPPELFTSIFQGGVRYNSYVFIALSQSLFGSKGVALSSFFVAYMIILTNIMSVLVMNYYGSCNKKSLTGALLALTKNPLIIGALLGVVVNMCNVHITGSIKQVFLYLANAATPLSLMSVGAGLIISMHIRKLVFISYATLLKLIAMPLITIALIHYFGASGMAAHIAILYSAVPCAGNAYILARQMGGDHEAMASIITWSTLLSVFSVAYILSTVTL
ncbi:transporter [Rahnella aquatilis CIP 78.65 = ATCC 33071]|jgi:Predicted permeases|uniref:Putative permease n=1 Tax=Rahnella aquatilis (strain ATCC 33071 / DSM 4594 / JCM 1683 / NBRC 105701 / NCIMB 13365 / CIP 78.65) TaxID=745277 RepID=H2IRM6_RAHAC|nr:AEC family transporter [Rahnella aquatilis]AEX52527.1 putative permease [Rahnella aquatilis CIP 78.65 = ATCC 33071]KFD06644.1 transporter [Rahnella aquatilis CIP 78.65 = ATCC 33071]